MVSSSNRLSTRTVVNGSRSGCKRFQLRLMRSSPGHECSLTVSGNRAKEVDDDSLREELGGVKSQPESTVWVQPIWVVYAKTGAPMQAPVATTANSGRRQRTKSTIIFGLSQFRGKHRREPDQHNENRGLVGT